MIERFFRDIRKYAYFCGYSARVDLRSEVANSYLNWIWWVLEPLASMFIYYAIFVNILGRGVDNYVLFIYSSSLMWSFFNRCMLFDVQSVRLNREIVNKVYLPKFVLLISNLLFNGFKILISIAILFVMLIAFRVDFTWTMLWVIPIWMLLILFTFGIGMIAMHFGVFIDDLSHALAIFMNMLFYLSGVFYDLEQILPAPWGPLLVKVNPIACFMSAQRNALLYDRAPDMIVLLCWLVISLALCAAGVRLVYKYENSYVKTI